MAKRSLAAGEKQNACQAKPDRRLYFVVTFGPVLGRRIPAFAAPTTAMPNWEEEEFGVAKAKLARTGQLRFQIVDRDGANALTEENIGKGIDAKANQEINIHWSGKGDSNFSAGCQVIAGKSYINHRGELIDCSGFAASTYEELKTKTRGAYNFMADLVLALSGAGVNKVYYTLGRDETLDLEPTLGAAFAERAVRRLKKLEID